MPIRSAHETFLNGPHKAALEQIVQTAAFEAACQAALLSLVEEQTDIFTTPETSWQNGVRVSGARRVLEMLAALPFPNQPPSKPKEKVLNYGV